MEVLYLDHPIKIRLAHIDRPEKRRSQPLVKSQEALSDLCFGQLVDIQDQKYDRYKRLIAVVVTIKNRL